MQDIQANQTSMTQPCDRISAKGIAVTVVPASGEWHVVIVENGVERVQPFVQRDWALSYASGQRLRLGLPAHAAGAAGTHAVSVPEHTDA